MNEHAGISSDLAAHETLALRQAIEEFNEHAKKQTHQMLRLTNVIAWLTGAMTAGVIIQIYLAIVH